MTRNERSLRRTQCGVKGSLHFTANIFLTFSRTSLFVLRCTLESARQKSALQVGDCAPSGVGKPAKEIMKLFYSRTASSPAFNLFSLHRGEVQLAAGFNWGGGWAYVLQRAQLPWAK
jgi:hypothetical protein